MPPKKKNNITAKLNKIRKNSLSNKDKASLPDPFLSDNENILDQSPVQTPEAQQEDQTPEAPQEDQPPVQTPEAPQEDQPPVQTPEVPQVDQTPEPPQEDEPSGEEFKDNKMDNFFKDLPKLKIIDTPNIQNKFIQELYTKFRDKIKEDLESIVENANIMNLCNINILDYISNIERDIESLHELHENLLKEKLTKENSHYVDSIYFQKIMIKFELDCNLKFKKKYLGKFYYDLFNTLHGMNIKIPPTIKSYNILNNIIEYTYDDVFNILKFILETSINMTNDIISEFDFIMQMEDKESQGFNLKEFNTNLNYKLTTRMNNINYVYDKIKYIVNFQLVFANKFKKKMNSIADEVDIKYH